MSGVPAFVREISSTLAVHSQYVLHGNLRDRFVVRGDEPAQPARLRRLLPLLWETLRDSGYECLVTFDPVGGLGVFPAPATGDPDEEARRASDAAHRVLGTNDTAFGAARVPSLDALRGHLAAVVNNRDVRAAFVIDYASRLTRDVSALDAAEHSFFLFCEKLSRDARQLPAGGSGRGPLYNPILWLVDREQDLPAWLTAGNERIRPVGLPRPDFGDRQDAARIVCRPMARAAAGPTADTGSAEDTFRTACDRFAGQADGLTLQEMMEVIRLARDRGVGLADLPDAVRTFKLGVLDNPWRRGYLRARIKQGEQTVAERVVGQPQAVLKTLDILKRAALGLSGAQAGGSSTRPRGVLFFAGPTGVGKTELAKTVATLVFGDETAYLRFDMSEFSAEHAGDRLIGAPPGYTGFDAGGELTNAVRNQPFQVVLFDEIEKAHPRILDKFLQILEDGRLTDGRGTTTHFSECVLIFTSNLGMTVDDGAGGRVPNVRAGEPYEEIERKVRHSVSEHFTTTINRPELLNRFGDNIVVFGFIDSEAAAKIFDAAVSNILRRVHDEHRVTLVPAGDVLDRLREWCTADLGKGGRGIGTALESYLINPLSRELFALDPPPGTEVRILDVSRDGSTTKVVLECTS